MAAAAANEGGGSPSGGVTLTSRKIKLGLTNALAAFHAYACRYTRFWHLRGWEGLKEEVPRHPKCRFCWLVGMFRPQMPGDQANYYHSGHYCSWGAQASHCKTLQLATGYHASTLRTRAHSFLFTTRSRFAPHVVPHGVCLSWRHTRWRDNTTHLLRCAATSVSSLLRATILPVLPFSLRLELAGRLSPLCDLPPTQWWSLYGFLIRCRWFRQVRSLMTRHTCHGGMRVRGSGQLAARIPTIVLLNLDRYRRNDARVAVGVAWHDAPASPDLQA